MIIGFTGTQEGLSYPQRCTLLEMMMMYINAPSLTTVVHGDCIGADEAFGYMAKGLGCKVVIRPGCGRFGESPKRAYTEADQAYPPEGYLKRNKKIVDDCSLLLACPKGMEEELRSGTWSTIRYAIDQQKLTVIIYPDGSEKTISF